MNITKLKRRLAKRGIGDPLNQLVYTGKEIEEMKKRGEVLDLSNPATKRKMRELARARKGRGRINRSDEYMKGYQSGYAAVSKKSQTILLSSMDVRLRKVAELWCEWNGKELDAKDFALNFGKIFKHECSAEWRKRLKTAN